MSLTSEVMVEFLPQLLEAMPKAWRGTTFKNHNLLGRDVFSERLCKLLMDKKAAGDKQLTEAELLAVGNAEDYFRVASNLCTTLELWLATKQGMDVSAVWTFGSTTMPIVAVALTAGANPVHLYLGDEKPSLGASELELLELLGAKLVLHPGAAPAANGAHGKEEVVLAVRSAVAADSVVDGVVEPCVLYIHNIAKINGHDILVIRKRMSTPVTTPVCETMLQQASGVPVTTNIATPSDKELAEFYAHLQELCGTEVDASSNPAIFTAGLPALCSLYMTLIKQGGADMVMCSTAYGGSNQLTDLLTARAKTFNKHTFDIQGDVDIVESIRGRLDAMAKQAASLQRTTVLFVEIPTNPDMKVPPISFIAEALQEYRNQTGKQVMLLVDTTFAPHSNVMGQARELAADLPVMVFISMSKSVSRGKTTAGGIIGNHTKEAKAILEGVHATSRALDTVAKDDQLQRLVANHVGVEKRCLDAYQVAINSSKVLVQAVQEACDGHTMVIRFPTPDEAAKGFTSSTYSFNLPPPKGASREVNEALAQDFTDLLCAHKEFKPCVSFGQDNGLVYATVPATSTQGAIAEEDKAKQAVGGVQLCRLSFPPSLDEAAVQTILKDAVKELYSRDLSQASSGGCCGSKSGDDRAATLKKLSLAVLVTGAIAVGVALFRRSRK